MKLNILILSHYFYPSIGGIETMSHVLAEGFSKAGHEVRVVTWSKSKDEKFFPFPVKRSPRFSELIEQYKWAHVILENNPCLRLSYPLTFIRKPHIVVLQTWFNSTGISSKLLSKLKSIWLNNASAVVAISQAVRSRIFPRATIINNCYNDENFVVVPQTDKERDLVFVGRLISDKGADLAIKAVHRFNNLPSSKATGKKINLTIVGSGTEENVLQSLVESLHLQNEVRFEGPLSGFALRNCLNMHRFIVVPSRWEEPFGIVALEGIACGCIPLVSDGGGLPEAIGNSGMTFKRNDVGALTECLREIVQDPERQNSFKHQMAKHLLSFTRDHIVEEYLSLMKDIFEKRTK